MLNDKFVKFNNVESEKNIEFILNLPEIFLDNTYSNPYSDKSLGIPDGYGFIDNLLTMQENFEQSNFSHQTDLSNQNNLEETNTNSRSQKKDVRKYVKNWLMQNQGLTNEQASALTGVWWAESRLDPSIHEIGKENNPNAGKGIAQWTGKFRQKHAEDIYKQIYGKSKPIKQMSLDEQLNVAIAEFKERGTWQQFINAKDIKTATDIVWRGYENGGNSLASHELMKKTYGKAYNKQWSDRFRFAQEISKL